MSRIYSQDSAPRRANILSKFELAVFAVTLAVVIFHCVHVLSGERVLPEAAGDETSAPTNFESTAPSPMVSTRERRPTPDPTP
jgi:hypothetical protein